MPSVDPVSASIKAESSRFEIVSPARRRVFANRGASHCSSITLSSRQPPETIKAPAKVRCSSIAKLIIFAVFFFPCLLQCDSIGSFRDMCAVTIFQSTSSKSVFANMRKAASCFSIPGDSVSAFPYPSSLILSISQSFKVGLYGLMISLTTEEFFSRDDRCPCSRDLVRVTFAGAQRNFPKLTKCRLDRCENC